MMKKHCLRAITESDRELILPWRNAPQTREFMFTSHEISEAEHLKWFEGMMSDKRCEYFIFEVAEQPSAVCALTDLNFSQKNSFWAAYQSPDAAPGTGALMEFYLLDYAFNQRGLHKVCGEVLASNKNVLSLHKSFGFSTEGVFIDQHFDGSDFVDVHRVALFSDQWSEIRKKYTKLLKIDG